MGLLLHVVPPLSPLISVPLAVQNGWKKYKRSAFPLKNSYNPSPARPYCLHKSNHLEHLGSAVFWIQREGQSRAFRVANQFKCDKGVKISVMFLTTMTSTESCRVKGLQHEETPSGPQVWVLLYVAARMISKATFLFRAPFMAGDLSHHQTISP